MRHNSKSEQPLKRLKIGTTLRGAGPKGYRRVKKGSGGQLGKTVGPGGSLRVWEGPGSSNEIRDISIVLMDIHLPHTLFYSFIRNYNDANLSLSNSNEQNMEIHHRIVEREALCQNMIMVN